MILYAATSNRGKLAELLMARDESGIVDLTIEPLPGLGGIATPAEDGATYEENAATKAIYYSAFTGELVLAEDSGLEVEALAGAPGVRSARYAGETATDAGNNALLIKALMGKRNRRARFISVVAVARCGHLIYSVRGEVPGEILPAPRGGQGFGYDPLFFCEPFGCAFGELPPARKFQVSHRGNALRSLFREWPKVVS